MAAAHIPQVDPRAPRERPARGERLEFAAESLAVVQMCDRREIVNAKGSGFASPATPGGLGVDDVAAD
jgi:hypothetical protein